MRFLVTFGALAVAAGLFAACGDDDGGDGNTAGTGGTGGAAGNAGSAGRGGTAGNAGTAGNGNGGTAGNGNGGTAGNGNGGTAGNGNAGTAGTAGTSGGGDEPDAGDAGLSDAGDAGGGPCTGCLELRATVAANDESGFFQIVYGTPVDMSDGTALITFRVSGLSPDDQVRIEPFATDADFTFGPSGNQVELTAVDGFVDLELDVANDITDGAFDKTAVIAVGVFVGYTGGIGAESTQALSVLLDSVEFAGIDTPDLAFTTDNEAFDRTDNVGIPATEVVHH